MALNDETIELSMSLCAALAAKDIAAATGTSTTDALGKLLASTVGSQLYDDALKLWWESPRDLAAAYLAENDLPMPRSWDAQL